MQKNNIEKVKIGHQANLPKEELAQLTMTVIDQLIADCRYVNVSVAVTTRVYGRLSLLLLAKLNSPANIVQSPLTRYFPQTVIK